MPYRAYLYIVLTASAFIAITGAASLASFAIDEAWPGRVIFGRSTTDLASGLARLIVASPIWYIHWRLAQRQVTRDGREEGRFLRQAYLLVLMTVSIVFVGFTAREMIMKVLEGAGSAIEAGDLSNFIVWGAVWTFHWGVVRRSWRPGDTGRPLHRWYLYGASAASPALLAFGLSSVLAELLRFAYEGAFLSQTISVSGPWTRDLQGGLAGVIVGGIGWGWHWWRSARGDSGSVLREVYSSGGSVVAAGSSVSTVILAVAILLRPALGESPDSLAARWDSLPRLAADLAVAAAVWLHLSPASPWSRRGIEPATSLPGATTVDVRAWELFGVGAMAASAVIAIALVLALPVVATSGLLVDTSSQFDGIAAIVASGLVGVAIAGWSMRRGRAHDAADLPNAAAVTRFFHFGIAAAGLLATVGGTAAALYIFLKQALDGDLGMATLLDARWGIAIGVVGAVITLWRWRAIQSFQLRSPRGPSAGPEARPKVRVIHPDEREVEVSSGAMSRLAGVSKATVGARGLHLAIATIPPGHRSTPHYHTNCESAIYVASGHGTFLTGDRLDEALPIGAGDFIYVPADAPHQPVNGSDTEPLVLIVARNAPVELVVELQDAPSNPK